MRRNYTLITLKIMKKFRVLFVESFGGEVCVEANTIEEAEEKAYDMWASGKASADGNANYETIEANEI